MKTSGLMVLTACALAALGCGAESSVDVGSSPEVDAALPILEETCNFTDDDGDGLVDEGFPWVFEEPTVIHRVEKFSSLGPVAPAGDGTWLVTGTDGVSEPGDRLFVLRIEADGRVLEGPTHITIPYCSNGTAVVAPMGSQVVAMAGSRTWAGRPPCPAEGCPLLVAVLDDLLHVVSTAEAPLPDFPNVLVTGLACTFDTCFATVGDGVNTAIARFGISPLGLQAYQKLGADGVLLPVPASVGDFLDAVAIEDGVVVWRRLRASDLSEERAVGLMEAGRLLGARFLPDGGFVIVYADAAEKQGLARFGDRQQLLHEVSDVPLLLDMSASGTGLVHVGRFRDSLGFAAQLTRLDDALSPVRAPNNPVRVAMYAGRSSLILDDGLAVLLTANYDGQAIEARRIVCDTELP